MTTTTIPASTDKPCVRASTLIAEALVERKNARQIVAAACRLELPDPTVEIILAACGCTAGTRPAPATSFGAD